MKKKKLKDYTQEEFDKLNYTDQQELLTRHYIAKGTKIGI